MQRGFIRTTTLLLTVAALVFLAACKSGSAPGPGGDPPEEPKDPPTAEGIIYDNVRVLSAAGQEDLSSVPVFL